ncbi:MAG: hypothetical protein AAB375_03365 [Patescibacteria group bacterium]
MATVKQMSREVRPARAYPTPKRKPARLGSEVARFRGHNQRKPKSR